MPPLGKVPQDVHVNVKVVDDLLDVVCSKMESFDVLFFKDVQALLMMFDILPLDDDKLSEVDDIDALNFLTVLDEQGDVEANLCGLL